MTELLERVELRERVALMRELGVVEWDGIKLGPDPNAQVDTVKPKMRTKEEIKKEHDEILFASSEGVEANVEAPDE